MIRKGEERYSIIEIDYLGDLENLLLFVWGEYPDDPTAKPDEPIAEPLDFDMATYWGSGDNFGSSYGNSNSSSSNPVCVPFGEIDYYCRNNLDEHSDRDCSDSENSDTDVGESVDLDAFGDPGEDVDSGQDGDGYREKIAWALVDDGFLAYDKVSDGVERRTLAA